MITCNNLNDWKQYGRMANQLFCVANVLGYSAKHNLPYALPEWKYAQYFNGLFTQTEAVVTGCPEYREQQFHYEPIPFMKDIDLIGYWQSKKYWEHCESQVKEMFSFKAAMIGEITEYIYQRTEGERIPVSVHVRRGDYVSSMSHYYYTLDMEWYKQAMSKFDPETHHFFVVSDDIPFCVDNFPKNLTISFSKFNEVQDMCLMTLCRHNIIANSSFSWWGSYLNQKPDKTVVAPSHWFKPVAGHDTSDLYLPTWTLLANN